MNMRKTQSLILMFVLALSSLLIIQVADAQVSKPSVPHFTLQLGSHPYDVPPVTYTDPYTGKTSIVSAGCQVKNESIEVMITNPPFTSTIDASGNYTHLYYNVQFKGHYTDKWLSAASYYNVTGTAYTVVSFSIEKEFGTVTRGGAVDVQVRAQIGHMDRMRWDSILPESMQYYQLFAGETGEWSSTQTITVGEPATANPTVSPTSPPQPTQNPTATTAPTQNTAPMQPGTQTDVTFGVDPSTVVLVVAVAVLAVAVVLLAVKVNSQRARLSAKQSATGWVHKWDD